MSKVLTSQTIKEIDHWLGKFPKGKQRSAIIGSLHAAQHQNHGFLTSELMDAVAEYLDVPRTMKLLHFIQCFKQKKLENMKYPYAQIFHACSEALMKY